MTVLVSVKINDGVVMAADSASSFASGMIYHHAQKIVNLSKGLPIGAMVTGAGGIGNESIDTLLKDLRRRFTGSDADHLDWKLDPDRYTVEQVSVRVRQFLFEEKSKARGVNVWTKVRLCGYSAGRSLAEVWEIQLMGPDCAAPKQIQGEQDFGRPQGRPAVPLPPVPRGGDELRASPRCPTSSAGRTARRRRAPPARPRPGGRPTAGTRGTADRHRPAPLVAGADAAEPVLATEVGTGRLAQQVVQDGPLDGRRGQAGGALLAQGDRRPGAEVDGAADTDVRHCWSPDVCLSPVRVPGTARPRAGR